MSVLVSELQKRMKPKKEMKMGEKNEEKTKEMGGKPGAKAKVNEGEH